MAELTIELKENDYQRSKNAAKLAGKSVQIFIYEWIARLPDYDESFDIILDPDFKMEGYNSEAPTDL